MSNVVDVENPVYKGIPLYYKFSTSIKYVISY